MEYVEAARSLGAPRELHRAAPHRAERRRTGDRVSTLLVPTVIPVESFLSFPAGVQEPQTSWVADQPGYGLAGLRRPGCWIPAAFLAATMFAFNFIGDGLRDALDLQRRERRGTFARCPGISPSVTPRAAAWWRPCAASAGSVAAGRSLGLVGEVRPGKSQTCFRRHGAAARQCRGERLGDARRRAAGRRFASACIDALRGAAHGHRVPGPDDRADAAPHRRRRSPRW